MKTWTKILPFFIVEWLVKLHCERFNLENQCCFQPYNGVIFSIQRSETIERLKRLATATHTETIEGLTLEYDLFGGISLKIDDFTYVKVNYDYRYTCNSKRKLLAENIAKLIAGKL